MVSHGFPARSDVLAAVKGILHCGMRAMDRPSRFSRQTLRLGVIERIVVAEERMKWRSNQHIRHSL
jgi:hypothetical protein